MEKGTLVLTRSDIQNALSLAEYLPVIEEARFHLQPILMKHLNLQ